MNSYDGINPESERFIYSEEYKLLAIDRFNHKNKHKIFVYPEDLNNLGIYSKYLELIYIKICKEYKKQKYNNQYLIIACGYLDQFRVKNEKIKYFLKKLAMITNKFNTNFSPISPQHYKYCIKMCSEVIHFNDYPHISSQNLIWFHEINSCKYDIRWSGSMEFFKNEYVDKMSQPMEENHKF